MLHNVIIVLTYVGQTILWLIIGGFWTLMAALILGLIWVMIKEPGWKREQIAALARLKCRKCGQAYGQATAEKAPEITAAAYREEMKRPEYKDCIVDVLPGWIITCPNCSHDDRFDTETNQMQD